MGINKDKNEGDKMKRLWIGIGLGVVIVLVIIFGITQVKRGAGEIKIGVITALTGEQGKYGESSQKGIDMAMEEVNINGGISGKKVIAVYEDSQGDPKLAVSALQKLISADKVFIMIGALASSDILAMAPVAEKNKVILLASSATAPTIRSPWK